MTPATPLRTKTIANTIRGLSMDAVQRANSGHPGLPLGMADVMSVLWSDYLRFNPSDPSWVNRDRFVLSGGHGSMLLYSALHLFGYDLSLEDIRAFRQWESKTPGHPEYMDAPGVETTTGPLGQGLANAVGMAIAEASLSGRYNVKGHSVIEHHTYVMAGDGDLQEGISHEACSLAGHLKLNKLILLYDSNQITIDGDTQLSFSEDIPRRFASYGWNVLEIDGHDYNEISVALKNARSNTGAPTIIVCNTTIGFGSPNKAGKSSAHGEPLGVDEIVLTKKNLGIPNEHFYIPESLVPLASNMQQRGTEWQKEWYIKFDQYQKTNPELSSKLQACLNGNVPSDLWNIPTFGSDKAMATRAASGKVLEHIAPQIESLFGGSADLTPSNKTKVSSQHSFSSEDRTGTYLHYGVREHGMAAIMNGLYLHGGFIPYAGTFFAFADYMRPAMRMSALMKLPIIYVFTHDSIGLGEDGPTHQPIAHLTSLRAMPNMRVIRPMDANETTFAWQVAISSRDQPTCLVLSRQNLVIPDRSQDEYASADGLLKGAYVLTEDVDFDTIIIATGSEVEIVLNAKSSINANGHKIRLVSMPCAELFEEQDQAYKEHILPSSCTKRIAIEAGATMGWYQYVGIKGKVIGLDHFGASAPYKELYEHFGISSNALIEVVETLA